jgi:hypothetical protein
MPSSLLSEKNKTKIIKFIDSKNQTLNIQEIINLDIYKNLPIKHRIYINGYIDSKIKETR